jgi:hypothetical protein
MARVVIATTWGAKKFAWFLGEYARFQQIFFGSARSASLVAPCLLYGRDELVPAHTELEAARGTLGECDPLDIREAACARLNGGYVPGRDVTTQVRHLQSGQHQRSRPRSGSWVRSFFAGSRGR